MLNQLIFLLNLSRITNTNLHFAQAGSMEDIDKLLSTPKKKKLTTTSQYIYRNLFQVRLVFNLK